MTITGKSGNDEPNQTTTWRLTSLRRCEVSRELAATMSLRLLQFVQNMPATGSVTLTWAVGPEADVRLDLSARGVAADFWRDLTWISGKWLTWEEVEEMPTASEGTIIEVRPSVLDTPVSELAELVLNDDGMVLPHPPLYGSRPLHRKKGWPTPNLSNSTLLMETLRSLEPGYQLRIHLSPANAMEMELAEYEFLQSEQKMAAEETDRYLGTPVRMRVLVGVPTDSTLPFRMKIAFADWTEGALSTEALDPAAGARAWTGGGHLIGHAVPEQYAAVFTRLPAAGMTTKIIGLPIQPFVADPVPLVLPHSSRGAADTGARGGCGNNAIKLGSALNELGKPVPVMLQAQDALRHLHIVGGSGTGKSSLEAALVHGIAKAGLGAVVLDAHGTLIQRVMAELPAEEASRALVVDSSDRDNPVRININHCTDPETATSETIEMLYSIFDPRRTGIIGPRFERIFRQVMGALTIIYGKDANLSMVPSALADKNRIEALVSAVASKDLALAKSMHTELGTNSSNEFADVLAWVNSKFDRFIRNPIMRGALGTGKDAVNIPELMENNGILLVNLAAPQIGQEQARMLGMMWLEKVSLAMAQRGPSADPFFVVVDEAQLFRESLLEEMLAEGRKFGLSVTLAHQHFEQLSPQLLSALEGNAASVFAFRSSIADAARVAERLGQWPGGSLARLDNMTAAATMAIPQGQTQPFTLFVDHNNTVAREVAADPEAAELVRLTVEIESQEKLVDPYRNTPIIGEVQLRRAINDFKRARS